MMKSQDIRARLKGIDIKIESIRLDKYYSPPSYVIGLEMLRSMSYQGKMQL